MEKGHFQALIPKQQAPKKVEFSCGCKPSTHNGYANLASYKSHINAAHNNVPPIGSSHNKNGTPISIKDDISKPKQKIIKDIKSNNII